MFNFFLVPQSFRITWMIYINFLEGWWRNLRIFKATKTCHSPRIWGTGKSTSEAWAVAATRRCWIETKWSQQGLVSENLDTHMSLGVFFSWWIIWYVIWSQRVSVLSWGGTPLSHDFFGFFMVNPNTTSEWCLGVPPWLRKSIYHL